MRVVGLSGSIATGKSTVSRLLQQEGLNVIDCDALAKEQTAKGTWGWRRVRAAFGPDVMDANGEIDRERLGALIFADAAARRRLNAATHLPVALALLRTLAWHWLTMAAVVVVDMPLLFETGSYKLTSTRVLVACSPEVQLARLLARDGGSEERARDRIGSQMPQEAKRRLATLVVDNNGTLQDLEPQVRSLAAKLKRGARVWGLLTSPLALVAAVLGGVLALW